MPYGQNHLARLLRCKDACKEACSFFETIWQFVPFLQRHFLGPPASSLIEWLFLEETRAYKVCFTTPVTALENMRSEAKLTLFTSTPTCCRLQHSLSHWTSFGTSSLLRTLWHKVAATIIHQVPWWNVTSNAFFRTFQVCLQCPEIGGQHLKFSLGKLASAPALRSPRWNLSDGRKKHFWTIFGFWAAFVPKLWVAANM